MAEEKCSARLAALGAELGLMGRQLQVCHAAIVVAVGALEAQNADRDREVALVLQRHVGDRLDEHIEKLRELVARIK